MPLSGGKYVAPHWVNNSAPALDAAELQAICDTVVKNQTEAGKISGLQSAINGRARVQVVTYIGTGTYGESYPNRVTFDFPPKFVFCSGAVINTNRTGAFALFRDGALYGPVSWGGFYITRASFSGNSVSWYTYSSSNESGQANARDQKYTIIGIA